VHPGEISVWKFEIRLIKCLSYYAGQRSRAACLAFPLPFAQPFPTGLGLHFSWVLSQFNLDTSLRFKVLLNEQAKTKQNSRLSFSIWVAKPFSAVLKGFFQLRSSYYFRMQQTGCDWEICWFLILPESDPLLIN